MTLLRPLCYSFIHPSLCLLAPSSLPYSFVHPSRSIFPPCCRSHALTTRSVAPSIHRPDLLSCVLHSPPLVSSIVLLSASLQSTVLGHGAVAVQLHLVLLMLERRLSLPPFIILTPCLREFCCRPFVPLSLRSVHPSCSPFIRQRISRSVHLSSGSEPIRYIHPSLSRSVSPLFCPSFISRCLLSNNSSMAVRRTLHILLK